MRSLRTRSAGSRGIRLTKSKLTSLLQLKGPASDQR